MFNLQLSLPIPVLLTNIVLYKRQLWRYNLGVHSLRLVLDKCMFGMKE